MKKKLFFTAAALTLCVGAVFAQPTAQNVDNPRFKNAEQVKIEGVLVLKNGFISVESGGKIYHTPQLGRYTGFLDGLKENAKVSMEGWSVPNPRSENTAFLRIAKFTLNGKEYDLSHGDDDEDESKRDGVMKSRRDNRQPGMKHPPMPPRSHW
jgi:hypothetical protein